MSKKSANISEIDLHAYVDNQLSATRSREVEAWLKDHPEDAQRVSAWQMQNMAISDHYNDDRFNRIPEHLSPQRIYGRNMLNLRSIAASGLLMIATGLTGWYAHSLYTSQQHKAYELVIPAITAYQVYSVDNEHPVEISAKDQQHLIKWLSRRIKHSLTIPDLDDEGYHLLGGRLIAANHGPAAQLMYENKNKNRISMLVINSGNQEEMPYRFVEKSGVRGYYWRDDGISYAVTGILEKSELKNICEEIYDQLEEKIKT